MLRPYSYYICNYLPQNMTFNPEKHHRQSIRIRGYDYTQAYAYFVTLCTHQRRCLFGQIVDGAMYLNCSGQFIQTCWKNLPNHFPFIELDVFVVMPNHIHGIIIITEKNDQFLRRGEAFLPGYIECTGKFIKECFALSGSTQRN